MKTKNLPADDRIRFALRHYFPTDRDVQRIKAEMKKRVADIERLTPRDFGKLAREAMSVVWK
jgi:hypothetical protein